MDLEFQVAPEDLARSLIREFFLKQNYKNSLQAFENEDTRQRVKMTKIDLIKLLSMERLIKNNKLKPQPMQTMLEILTDYLFSRFKNRQQGSNNIEDQINSNIDTQSTYSQNVKEYQPESTFGSQTHIQPKIKGDQSSKIENKQFKENIHIHSAGVHSNINNYDKSDNSSYLSSKNSFPSSGLNSNISNNGTSNISQTSWMTSNSNSYNQNHSLEQQKPPKSANSFENSVFSQQNQMNKLPPQMKNPLSEKGADYLSVLEEQNKRNSYDGSNKIGGNSQNIYQNNNNNNPFSSNIPEKKQTNTFNDNDDGEFKFESRRGNMKKVVRQPSNDKKNIQNQNEQIVSIRTSINGFPDNTSNSNIESNVTTTKNMNSDFFNNFNQNFKQDDNQNQKLDFNDPLFGEGIADSRIMTKSTNQEKKQQQEERPQSRQSINKSKQIEPQQQQQDQQQFNMKQNSKQEIQDDDKPKQFNFFNKKKRDESIPSQQSQNNFNKDSNDIDELDQMLGGGLGTTTASRQFDNNLVQKQKKGIFDDEDLDFSNNNNNANSRNKQINSQIDSSNNDKKINQISDTDHVKMDFFNPGTVNFNFVPPKINFQKTVGMQSFSKKNVQNLTGGDIQEIRKLLFSQSQNKFLPTSWAQGFILNENDDTFYGLFQKEGGPCGVIACVQAFYLKYLFYVYPTTSPTAGKNIQDYKNKTLRENCLIAGLAEILFNARGEDNTIRLAVLQNTSAASSTQSIPIESCGYISAKVQTIEQAYDALHSYKSDYIGQRNYGVTIFLYSVILTKGVKNIQEEMDTPDNALIGHHGHCSQEQVNLFLTGKARSNCFDGEKVLDGDYKLKGIDQRAPFGFLTIFEHLKYIEVGSYLKTPLFPIWIICKEYHYSVIFSKDFRSNEKQNQPHFDLVYYDELYNAEDRIILTVTQKKYAKQSYTSSASEQGQQHFLFNRNNGTKGDNEEDEDMIPVIELVMRTKWGKEISVDWNGTQPIL